MIGGKLRLVLRGWSPQLSPQFRQISGLLNVANAIKRVATGYGSIRREIEETLVLPISTRRSIPELLASVRSSLNHLGQSYS